MKRFFLCVALSCLIATMPAMAQTAPSAVPQMAALGSAAVGTPPPPAEAAAAAAQEGVPGWIVSQGKTFTYRVLASVDALVVGYLYTGTLVGGGGIALLNAVVSSALYDAHEVAWNALGPDPRSDPAGIALVKTVSYRVVSIANVLTTGLIFTGDVWLSSGLALGNAVIDSTIYFFHELAWTRWGPPIQQDVPTASPVTGRI